MKKAAVLIISIFVVAIGFSLVSCQKKETPKETESVTEPAGGYSEKEAPEAGGYGEKAPAAGGYGEEAPATGGD